MWYFGFAAAMGILDAMGKEAGHQEEISKLKERPWFGFGNGENSPSCGSLKMEKRTLIGCRTGYTLNILEGEKPENKAEKDELEMLKGHECVKETREKRTVHGESGFNVRDYKRGKIGLG